jgi:hypothetical protein
MWGCTRRERVWHLTCNCCVHVRWMPTIVLKVPQCGLLGSNPFSCAFFVTNLRAPVSMIVSNGVGTLACVALR